MRTYLKVTFSADGEKPSVINECLAGLGFIATQGNHDWVYEWPQSASVDEILDFGDRIHAELHGMGALFEMETL